MVVGARQSFQIFRQNISFLENNRALSKFLYGILHYTISIINYKSIKNNFILTMQATLMLKKYSTEKIESFKTTRSFTIFKIKTKFDT